MCPKHLQEVRGHDISSTRYGYGGIHGRFSSSLNTMGLPAPKTPIRNHDWRPQWRKNVSGLRALRVLQEITPFLLGREEGRGGKGIEFLQSLRYSSRMLSQWRYLASK